jgi:septal ring factor EnvC (AmiA/AmiB activator)
LKAEEDVAVDLFKAYGMDPGNMVSDLQREAAVALKVAQYLKEVKDKQAEMMGPQDDPLVKLKEQELQQSAQRDQQKAQADEQRLQADVADRQEQDRIDRERIQSNEEIAQYRGNIAMQKMNQPQGVPNAAKNRPQ